jgi:hypothetical protein
MGEEPFFDNLMASAICFLPTQTHVLPPKTSTISARALMGCSLNLGASMPDGKFCRVQASNLSESLSKKRPVHNTPKGVFLPNPFSKGLEK